MIIVGSGPNGLVAGAYLSKAGLKTLVLDGKLEIGGGLATEMVAMGGVYHSTHAIYMPMVDYAPPYKDLKLEEEKRIRHVYPEVQFALPLRNGKSLCLYRDVERTCDSLKKISKRDSETYREISIKFKGYVDAFLAPATYAPAMPALDQLEKMEKIELGREISSYTPKSPLTIVNELFEAEPVKALFLYISCMWGLDPEGEGTGYLVPLYINRATNYRMCIGGTHTLAQAFYKIIYENGGEVIGGFPVVRIVIEQGRAKGVEVIGAGREKELIGAEKAVISTLNPHQTFLELVGEGCLEREFVSKIKLWKWEEWSLFTISFVLSEPPDFKAAVVEPDVNKSFIYVLGYERPEEFVSHYRMIKERKLKGDAGFNCCFPSLHDPSLVKAAVYKEGKYTGLISQMVPYDLEDGGAERWYEMKFREEVAKRCLEMLQAYAPNISRDNLLALHVSTPKGISDKFPDMAKGSIKQGAYHPFQLGYMRPNEECSGHRTPIERLYIGGASTHSGGTVILGPGYLVANAVAEDLSITKWWTEPEMITEARRQGFL